MLVLAALVGLLGGLASVAFRELIRLVQRGAWGEWTYTLDVVRGHPWWWILLAPAVGGLIVGPLIHRWAREARGHGIPEVMEAVAVRGGHIRPRQIVVKALASAVTIGTGGSVGREGPIVHIGSGVGSLLGQWTRISGPQLRTLTACGAAAGIAGTFNAPVAGALFAVEVILGDFAVMEFSPIVISSVLATVVSRHFLGDFPAFAVPAYELVSPWELVVYIVLGLVAGGVALLFISTLYRAQTGLEAAPVPRWLLPAVGGLAVGSIGLAYPQVLGVGYEATSAALAGELGIGLVALLILAKLVATSISLGSGASGGIFAPSLFLGAMAGSLVGGLAHTWFPAVTGGQGAYAIVGMGAVVAGATQAPISAILIIFEMTSDYKLILPLMVACIIATVVTTRGHRSSIYTEKLKRRGIEIFRGHELNILRGITTRDVMTDDLVVVDAGSRLEQLLSLLSEEPRSTIYVTGESGVLVGVIRQPDLYNAVAHAEALAPVVVAGDLALEEMPTLSPDTGLDTVMRIFAEQQPEELPVLDGTGRLRGVVTRRHVMDAYSRELMKRDMAMGLGGRLDAARTQEVSVGGDHLLLEVDAPAGFVGRSLQDLAVRSRYGVQILLVRRRETGSGDVREIVPEGSTRVHPGDRLVLLGPRKAVTRFRG